MPIDRIEYEEPCVVYQQICPEDWWKHTEEIQYITAPIPRAKPASNPTLEERFKELAKAWKSETRGYSITSQKYAHPAYQSILVLGEQVVPFILQDLQANGGRWFEALKALTKRSDIAKSCNSYEDAVKAWVAWGKESKLIQ